MTAGPNLELSSRDRAIVYQGDRVLSLRAGIALAVQAVHDGAGDAIVPFVGLPIRDHLAQLRIDLVEAEADLAFMTEQRGPTQ